MKVSVAGMPPEVTIIDFLTKCLLSKFGVGCTEASLYVNTTGQYCFASVLMRLPDYGAKEVFL